MRGCLAAFLLSANTLLWAAPIMLIALIKLLIPIPAARRVVGKAINAIAFVWAQLNNFNIRHVIPIHWDIRVPDDLSRSKNYLVISNHTSAVDIAALQMVFNSRIPFFRFFLKSVLIWVPFLGLAWWALDYPFMKRYSKEFLARNPAMKGRDLEITRRACERYGRTSVAIMNFPEGTRFTRAKHDRQKSPFTYLLKPKAGGMAYVLSAMGESIDSILNVTLVYPDGNPTLWRFLRGDMRHIIVHAEKIPLSEDLLGDYSGEETFRNEFQRKVNDIWHKKDRLIADLLKSVV